MCIPGILVKTYISIDILLFQTNKSYICRFSPTTLDFNFRPPPKKAKLKSYTWLVGVGRERYCNEMARLIKVFEFSSVTSLEKNKHINWKYVPFLSLLLFLSDISQNISRFVPLIFENMPVLTLNFLVRYFTKFEGKPGVIFQSRRMSIPYC